MTSDATCRTLDLAGAAVVYPAGSHETVVYAGTELSRFLYQLSGRVSACAAVSPSVGIAIELKVQPGSSLGAQGYRLQASLGGIEITGGAPAGLLYGVYRLLEELGMGFFAGGETYPDRPAALTLATDFAVCEQPAFAMRGNMLHYNFLCGVTDWGLDDYQFYFDQLARMRCNLLLMHWYDGEPGAAYQVEGEYLAGGTAPSSITKPWGARAALRTSEFSFGSGRFFDGDVFTSPMAASTPDLLSEIRESERVWCEATRYARRAGIHIAAGFEAPRGDPSDPQEMACFRARLQQFLVRNPQMTHFALWQHESGGCFGTTPPAPGTPAAGLLNAERATYAYLGSERRVWEAVRYAAFAREADAILARDYPHLRLVIVGWGGDRWMCFADLCLGLDNVLSPNAIFTCHENIDASSGPHVSAVWGQFRPERERWAMPWVEGDLEDCWGRQPNVESLGTLAPDALRKGCQGLLTLQWRTRDVEEETGYIASFAWDTKLTPDQFYQRFAARSFGPDQAGTMGSLIGELQQLGSRWTGVRGCGECSGMRWTGWSPHFPFELDTSAGDFLAGLAGLAADALATVPETELEESGAFHERSGQHAADQVRKDTSRPGVAAFLAATCTLRSLAGETDDQALRHQLAAVLDSIWDVRPTLIASGMNSPCYQAVDTFIIALHHLLRNAGATRKMARLHEILEMLSTLREQYVRENRIARLERLDYLLATIAFVLGYDAVAMRMAQGEQVDKALAEAARLASAAPRAAADVAAVAYTDIIAAGMHRAIRAFTRKLTTRCDFGTLATLNIKPLPLYWETLDKLQAYFPATPPNEVRCHGFRDEVHISWSPSRKATAQYLYRRRQEAAAWSRVNTTPLRASCRMFADHPPAPGLYEYAVTSLAGDGWESPRSHEGLAAFGAAQPGDLRIVGCKPFGNLTAGDTFSIDAAIIAERDLQAATLHWRQAGVTNWQEVPMHRRIRDIFTAVLPSTATATAGLVEWFVKVTDRDAQIITWPSTAPDGLNFTLVVCSITP